MDRENDMKAKGLATPSHLHRLWDPLPIVGFAMDDVQTTIGLHSLSLEERDEIPKQSREEWIAEFKTLIKFICEDTPNSKLDFIYGNRYG